MNSERDFLHDLMTPLSTALFIMDSFLEESMALFPSTEAQERLKDVMLSLESMRNLATERRENLIQQEEKNERR